MTGQSAHTRQKAPSAKRCIKTARPTVRRSSCGAGQKAPSAKRCIKTRVTGSSARRRRSRQKAPNAKRCIKTCSDRCDDLVALRVRKHRAPNNALRLPTQSTPLVSCHSTSQKAPSAKRCIKTPQCPFVRQVRILRQKAPSAKRCIKTRSQSPGRQATPPSVRKHRAPKGALRLDHVDGSCLSFSMLESTERQKVH